MTVPKEDPVREALGPIRSVRDALHKIGTDDLMGYHFFEVRGGRLGLDFRSRLELGGTVSRIAVLKREKRNPDDPRSFFDIAKDILPSLVVRTVPVSVCVASSTPRSGSLLGLVDDRLVGLLFPEGITEPIRLRNPGGLWKDTDCEGCARLLLDLIHSTSPDAIRDHLSSFGLWDRIEKGPHRLWECIERASFRVPDSVLYLLKDTASDCYELTREQALYYREKYSSLPAPHL